MRLVPFPRFFTLALVLVFGFLSLASCGPSPVPTPPPGDIGIFSEGIELAETEPGTLRLSGIADTVIGPADQIEVLNGGDDSGLVSVTSAPVAADGSFEVTFAGTLADVVRVQAFGPEGRSVPVDLKSDAAGGVEPVSEPPCGIISPALELDLPAVAVGQPSSGTVTLESNCAGLGFDGLALVDDAEWTFDVDVGVPTDLTPGATATITVTFTPQAAGASTNYLLLTLAGGAPAIRPVTLHGVGQP